MPDNAAPRLTSAVTLAHDPKPREQRVAAIVSGKEVVTREKRRGQQQWAIFWSRVSWVFFTFL